MVVVEVVAVGVVGIVVVVVVVAVVVKIPPEPGKTNNTLQDQVKLTLEMVFAKINYAPYICLPLGLYCNPKG